MLVLLGLLITVYLRLGTGRVSVQLAERLTTRLTFSVYLGWITVATIANISQTLWARGWRGEPLTESSWSLVMLGGGVLLAFLMSRLRKDWLISWSWFGHMPGSALNKPKSRWLPMLPGLPRLPSLCLQLRRCCAPGASSAKLAEPGIILSKHSRPMEYAYY